MGSGCPMLTAVAFNAPKIFLCHQSWGFGSSVEGGNCLTYVPVGFGGQGGMSSRVGFDPGGFLQP